MHLDVKSLLLSSVLTLFSVFVSAQVSTNSPRPSITAIKLDQDPTVDGNVLTDDVWQKVEPITSLKQIRPNLVYQYGSHLRIEICLHNQ